MCTNSRRFAAKPEEREVEDYGRRGRPPDHEAGVRQPGCLPGCGIDIESSKVPSACHVRPGQVSCRGGPLQFRLTLLDPPCFRNASPCTSLDGAVLVLPQGVHAALDVTRK